MLPFSFCNSKTNKFTIIIINWYYRWNHGFIAKWISKYYLVKRLVKYFFPYMYIYYRTETQTIFPNLSNLGTTLWDKKLLNWSNFFTIFDLVAFSVLFFVIIRITKFSTNFNNSTFSWIIYQVRDNTWYILISFQILWK